MKKKYRVNPDFIIQKIGEKTGIYDAENSVLYTLNDTATAIFLGFQLLSSKEEIIKKISLKYKKAEKEVSSDVNDLIRDMVGKKILL